MNGKLIKPALMGLIALSTVFILQRNKQKKAEAEAAPPPAVEEPTPTASPTPEPEVEIQAEISEPTPTPEPEISLKRGSTRQEVISVLGEPTGAMVISGTETLYYDDAEIQIRHGLVVRIPDELTTPRSASSAAAENRSPSADGQASQSETARAARRVSQPNLEIKNGGQEVDLSTMVGRGSVTIVDFYAEWCGPCRKIDPYLKEMARDSDVNLIKIDIVNWDTPVTKQHDIRSIPHIRVYDKSGRQVGKSTSNPNQVREYVKKAQGRS